MFVFISDNLLIFLTVIYIALTLALSFRLRKADDNLLTEYGKNFMEMPLILRHRILMRGKLIRITLLITAVIFSAVLFCRFVNLFNAFSALIISIVLGVLISLVFLEIVLFMSALIRRIISVNSASLNILFSSVIASLIMIWINYLFCEKISFEDFVISQISLGCCYIIMTVILIMVLREANDKRSRLTIKNIWKSAFLTIILFLLDLSMMSAYCYAFDNTSFSNVSCGLFDFVYYTVITFATVGYGDITPVSIFAKAVSVLTVITSILCITVLLSELAGVKKNTACNDNDNT